MLSPEHVAALQSLASPWKLAFHTGRSEIFCNQQRKTQNVQRPFPELYPKKVFQLPIAARGNGNDFPTTPILPNQSCLRESIILKDIRICRGKQCFFIGNLNALLESRPGNKFPVIVFKIYVPQKTVVMKGSPTFDFGRPQKDPGKNLWFSNILYF